VAVLIILLMLTYIDMYGTNILSTRVDWWLHAAIILAFPIIILHSKHRHIFLAPVAVYLRKSHLWDVPKMNLDFESVESEDEILLGLETLSAIPWKLRLDMLACVECKRCTDNCPAAIAGQELRPADFIKAGRKALFAGEPDDAVIGTVISEEALGQCTSCMACENICPVGIEHSQLLAGSKAAQTLAMGTGGVATEFLKAVGNYSNPFSATPDVRSALQPGLQEYS
jgi:heterodisulfide reductase subunit C